MSETIRIFVNAGSVDLPPGANAGAAIRSFDPALEQQIASGAAYLTDGRGIELSTESPLSAGAILRVIVRARRGENADTDA